MTGEASNATRARASLSSPIGKPNVGLNAPVEGSSSPLNAKLKAASSPAQSRRQEKTSSVPEDRATRGGRSRAPRDVAEVIEAYRVAFALTDSGLAQHITQPATNAMARRGVDRYGLPRVLAAVSIAPRHKWISAEFLAKRRVPSLQTILSDKVLAQLIAEVGER